MGELGHNFGIFQDFRQTESSLDTFGPIAALHVHLLRKQVPIHVGTLITPMNLLQNEFCFINIQAS